MNQAHLRLVKSCALAAKRLVYRWKKAIRSASGGQMHISVAQVVLFVRVLSAASNINIIMLAKRTFCGGMK